MIDKFLKELLNNGWKQREIAEKTDIQRVFITKLCAGANCSLETVIKIADAFEVSTDEVLGRSPSKPITPTEEKLLQTTDGDDDIARAALRSAQGEKLLKNIGGEGGREKAA